jgi:hypothetical protein
MDGRIVVVDRGSYRDEEVVDVYFENLEDAHSLSRFWASYENGVISDDRGNNFKVLENWKHETVTYPETPHTLNNYPPKHLVEQWVEIFKEDLT